MDRKRKNTTIIALVVFVVVALFLIYNLGYGLGAFIAKLTK